MSARHAALALAAALAAGWLAAAPAPRRAIAAGADSTAAAAPAAAGPAGFASAAGPDAVLGDVVARAGELDAARAASGRCGVCHPRERATFALGSHAAEGVRCVTCHRGNDAAQDAAAAHAGMLARPARAAVAGLCGGCHSDPDRMRPYGLPVDAVALYETSGHGRRLARGDAQVATCVDCHGAHGSLSAGDPRSPTHPDQSDHLCARCHGDASTVAGARTKHDVTAEWAASVHGHDGAAVPGAPGCVGCHSAHGAAPEGAGDVARMCGRCHEGERRAMDDGPHAGRLEREQGSECVSCHGAHAVKRAEGARLAADCAACHRADTPERKLGDEMLAERRGAEQSVAAAEALLERAERIPVPSEDYARRLEDARAEFRRLGVATHTVRLDAVREAAQQARGAADDVSRLVRHKLDMVNERWLMLAVYLLFAGLLAVALRRWRAAPGGGSHAGPMA